MLEGKIKQALKLVDADNDVTGVHELTTRVRHLLLQKHPIASEIHPSAVVQPDLEPAEEVIFEAVDGKAIQDAAYTTQMVLEVQQRWMLTHGNTCSAQKGLAEYHKNWQRRLQQ